MTSSSSSKLPINMSEVFKALAHIIKKPRYKRGGKGLPSAIHSDLNRPAIIYPGGKPARDARIAHLRQLYSGDPKALQQIDVYEGGNNPYSLKIREYIEALKSGDTKKADRLYKWFKENYPDI